MQFIIVRITQRFRHTLLSGKPLLSTTQPRFPEEGRTQTRLTSTGKHRWSSPPAKRRRLASNAGGQLFVWGNLLRNQLVAESVI